MQAAIDLASSSGRIVILPPFEVKVTTLTIPANGVRIWGQTGNGLYPLSRLTSTGINAPIIAISNALTRQFELRFVRISGNNTGSNQHGIYISGANCALFCIEDCIIDLCGGDGIRTNTTTYSYVLKNVRCTANSGYQFNIDAVNSPCVSLINCYAGVVADTKYGFYIQRGNVDMFNCNSLDGGTGAVSCVLVGNSAIGTALVTFRNCNFESFTSFGVQVDVGSDVIFYHCTFVSPSTGTVQPLYLVQPSGRSYIDPSCQFTTGGAAYNNADGLAIKIFDRWINAPGNISPLSASKITTFWNSNAGRSEPLMNLFQRMAIQEITTDPFTETIPSANYLACLVGLAHTVNLFDPQSVLCPEGRVVVVKDEVGNAATQNITVQTVNARFIDGASTKIISTNYGALKLVKHGNVYWQIP
jgi:hypothetical protein